MCLLFILSTSSSACMSLFPSLHPRQRPRHLLFLRRRELTFQLKIDQALERAQGRTCQHARLICHSGFTPPYTNCYDAPQREFSSLAGPVTSSPARRLMPLACSTHPDVTPRQRNMGSEPSQAQALHFLVKRCVTVPICSWVPVTDVCCSKSQAGQN